MRLKVIGTPLDVLTLAGAATRVAAMARAGTPTMVLHRDAHGLLRARRDPRVAAAEAAATLVLPDGMPLVWLARAAGLRHAERVYGPDLLEAVMAGPPLRHAFLGGGPGVAEKLVARLTARFPHQMFVGTLAARIDAPDLPDRAFAEALDALGADIAWIGLGTPKQDLWMAAHRPMLRTPVLVGCGAAFDFLSGTKPQAPRWMQRAGLEWAFRAATEPRRLGPRYLRTVPVFAVLAGAWLARRGWRRTSS